MFNHSSVFILLLALVTLASCAKPIADFSYNMEKDVLPVNLNTNNLSTNAEQYCWYIDGNKASEEAEPNLEFYNSGRHQITLEASKGKKSTQTTKEIILKAPEVCLVQIKTSKGDITVQLFDQTPLHRDNFLKLANENFYEGTLFHRVINSFMIQGGDPLSKDPTNKALGTGGPGYTIPAEFVDGLYHVKGYLAAARQGDNVNPQKKSSGSQFYIVHGKDVNVESLEIMAQSSGAKYSDQNKEEYQKLGGTPFLDTQYTVFGKVVSGLEVIDQIAVAKTDNRDRPLDDIKILKVIPIQ